MWKGLLYAKDEEPKGNMPSDRENMQRQFKVEDLMGRKRKIQSSGKKGKEGSVVTLSPSIYTYKFNPNKKSAERPYDRLGKKTYLAHS